MNIVITILASILGIIALLLLVALFLPKQYTIDGSVLIDKSCRDVFEYVRFVRNQEYYNKWVMMDPNMKKDFKGTDGTVGFIYAWDGNKKAGKGEQEIRSITDGKRIDMEIRFIKPFEGVAHTFSALNPISDNLTRVVMGMNGQTKYPMNLMTPLLKGVLQNDLDETLANLKREMERK